MYIDDSSAHLRIRVSFNHHVRMKLMYINIIIITHKINELISIEAF